MSGRIVLFGATGYTGRKVARALVRRGAAPLLAGRDAARLDALATELGGLPTARADAVEAEDAGLARLLGPGDVLVSTVGPFLRLGEPAVRAAVARGAAYLDSTGEPPFVRRVFEEFSGPAEASGTTRVPAFGYDYVPGNLTGALALAADGAQGRAARVEVGYFLSGRMRASAGTAASAVGVLLEPGFAWRGGRLVRERAGARVRSFPLAGRRRPGLSVGGSEHLALPRLHPELTEVGVYLGWAGAATWLAPLASAALAGARGRPGVRRALTRLAERQADRRSDGPADGPGDPVRTLVVAEAYDRRGRRVSRVTLEGPDGYDLTGELLAWAAVRAGEGALLGPGARGPVDAFGLEALERGCAEVGLVAVPDRPTPPEPHTPGGPG